MMIKTTEYLPLVYRCFKLPITKNIDRKGNATQTILVEVLLLICYFLVGTSQLKLDKIVSERI